MNTTSIDRLAKDMAAVREAASIQTPYRMADIKYYIGMSVTAAIPMVAMALGHFGNLWFYLSLVPWVAAHSLYKIFVASRLWEFYQGRLRWRQIGAILICFGIAGAFFQVWRAPAGPLDMNAIEAGVLSTLFIGGILFLQQSMIVRIVRPIIAWSAALLTSAVVFPIVDLETFTWITCGAQIVAPLLGAILTLQDIKEIGPVGPTEENHGL